MKYAILDGVQEEAQPGLSASCRACGRPVIAKCGEVRVWHWAHRQSRACDRWWESETEWHRNWKNHFPSTWQEFIQNSQTGERHIADVKTANDWVLEFQHSYLNPEERRSREAFYGPKLIWVVNGLRRKTDVIQFAHAWRHGVPAGPGNSSIRMVSADGCRLLQEWAGRAAQAFIDFGPVQGLWWILGKSPTGHVFVVRFSLAEFIEVHQCVAKQKTRNFDSLVAEMRKFVAKYETHRRAQTRRVALALPSRVNVRRRGYRR